MNKLKIKHNFDGKGKDPGTGFSMKLMLGIVLDFSIHAEQPAINMALAG